MKIDHVKIKNSLLTAVLMSCALIASAQVTSFSGVEPSTGMIPPHPSRLPETVIPAFPGATLPRRDAVDRRIIDCVRTGRTTTGNGLISDVQEVGGYPSLSYSKSELPKDSDLDGMPDDWEKKYGLNPKQAGDAAQDLDKDGYTNIEEFLNGTDPTEYVNYRNLGNNIDQISMQ